MTRKSKGTHWVSLFIDRSTAAYFNFFGIELNKIRDKSITHDIFRIQDDDSIMCGFYCFLFDFVFICCCCSFFVLFFSVLFFS